MKKIVFITILLFSTAATFGQQILWSTDDSKEKIKYIPYEDVTKEVLEFHSLYTYYYDFSGYTKKAFYEKFENLGEFSKIKDKTVVALKRPSESGSFIYVIAIDKDNIDMVGFSNGGGTGAQETYNGENESNRNRFEKWFKTLLN